MHFFDAPLPNWPTFAVNLRYFEERPPKRVVMPERNVDGIAEAFCRFETAGLAGFVAAIFEAMQNWRDNTQAKMPGFRDRVVHVCFGPDEGGLNLDMDRDTMEAIAESGQEAAELLARRFAPGSTAVLDWDNHRWVRFRSTLASLEEMLSKLGPRLAPEYEPPQPGDENYAALVARAIDELPSYKWTSEARREDAIRAATQLRQLAASWLETPRRFEKGAPSPMPELRARPKILSQSSSASEAASTRHAISRAVFSRPCLKRRTRSRSASSSTPRIWAARTPAFLALSMATVATGTPFGIWTIESRESRPSSELVFTGTPMTGRTVIGGHHAREVRRTAGARDDHAKAAAFRVARVGEHPLRGAVRRDDGALPGHSELVEHVARGLHDGQVRFASHDDADSRHRSLLVSDAQKVTRAPHVLEGLLGLGCHRGEMAHLATVPRFRLAVDVDRDAGDAGRFSQTLHPGPARPRGVADEVRHRRRGDLARRAEREGGDGTQVLLELAGDVRFDGVVPAVVGPGRDLVHPELTDGVEEHLDGDDPHRPERAHRLDRELCRPRPPGLARLAASNEGIEHVRRGSKTISTGG